MSFRIRYCRGMQEYVLGFLFNETKDKVVLLRKLRPLWQAGRLNGVGGKIETGESPAEAMRREFREEAGVDVTAWDLFARLNHDKWRVFVFSAFDSKVLSNVVAKTDEALQIIPADAMSLHTDSISNLQWLVPLARNPKDIKLPVIVEYGS